MSAQRCGTIKDKIIFATVYYYSCDCIEWERVFVWFNKVSDLLTLAINDLRGLEVGLDVCWNLELVVDDSVLKNNRVLV